VVTRKARKAMLTLGLAALAGLAAPAMAAAPNPAAVELARLADEYWQGYLGAHPTTATSIGDRRFDAYLEDISPKGLEAERARLTHVLERARALDAASLDHADRLTLDALTRECEDGLATLDCHFEDWVVDPLGGPQVEFLNLPDITPIRTFEAGRNYIRRLRAMGPCLDQHAANLARGLAAGRVASRGAVTRTIDEVDSLLAEPDSTMALLAPARDVHEGLNAAERMRLERETRIAVDRIVRPAFARYRDFLATQVLPAARPPERAGMSSLPGGEEDYRRLIRVYTSLDLTPAEIHEIGLREVARVRGELSALGERTLGTDDIAGIQRRLRGDPAMHFRTPGEIEATAREALERARAALPAWFGILPRTGCEVHVMGELEAKHSTIACYRNGTADGSRPGWYMLNTSEPGTRPRYEAEVLAFHESIPGHHLQIAIAQELEGLPAFRRHQGVTAYTEGWALYTEELADEMGLYSGDLDRMGRLSFDAWRDSRLVVDTGLHAMGWTRDEAIRYMTENTVLAENNIENEVDRYLTWPGQALAYKLGELEIRRLRAEAERRLGPRFDIRAFHDAVLRNGAVALPVLRAEIEAWIRESGG
jgi:uncharacterized protein (DUF885 family)